MGRGAFCQNSAAGAAADFNVTEDLRFVFLPATLVTRTTKNLAGMRFDLFETHYGEVMTLQSQAGYAGDIDPLTAYQELAKDSTAQLIDVRTRAEWSFVGIPDLGAIGREPILIEWQSWPHMQVAGDFLDKLKAALAERNVGTDTPLYFLCRSGVRSAAAAACAVTLGFERSFNIAGGFEGPPDPNRHRGAVAGWKANDLPWVQT
jgi:rhodanese-related sulfurtransferase